MHKHSLISGFGAAELGHSACDGVFFDGRAYRVCLHGLLPSRSDGTRPLEAIETQFHGGEEGCRAALEQWLQQRAEG